MGNHPNCERRAYSHHDPHRVEILELQYENQPQYGQLQWRLSAYKAPYAEARGGPEDLAWATLRQYHDPGVAWQQLEKECQELEAAGWRKWWVGPQWTNWRAWEGSPVRIGNGRYTYLPPESPESPDVDPSEPDPPGPTGPTVCQRVPLELPDRRKIIELVWLPQVQHWQIRSHSGFAQAVTHAGFGAMSTKVICEPTEEDAAREAFQNIVTYHLNNPVGPGGRRWSRWVNRPTWVMPMYEFHDPWDETAHRSSDLIWTKTSTVQHNVPRIGREPDEPEELAKVRADLVRILEARAAQVPEPELSHWDRLEI